MPDGLQILQGLVERDDVGVFSVEIEQTLLVRGHRTVADRLAHYHGTEAVLHRIDGGGADAARRRTAGEDQRVDAPGVEPRQEPGANNRLRPIPN